MNHPDLSTWKGGYGQTMLHGAIRYHKELLNHPDVSKVKDQDGMTPLHVAAKFHKEALKHPDVSKVKDKYGETPLHWAGWTGNLESAKLLLEYGANPHLGNNSGTTPLDLSVRQEHKKLEKYYNRPL